MGDWASEAITFWKRKCISVLTIKFFFFILLTVIASCVADPCSSSTAYRTVYGKSGAVDVPRGLNVAAI